MEILDQEIQNYDSNYTRFICISKKGSHISGSDRNKYHDGIPNKTGTFSVMSRFSAIGANLVKLRADLSEPRLRICFLLRH